MANAVGIMPQYGYLFIRPSSARKAEGYPQKIPLAHEVHIPTGALEEQVNGLPPVAVSPNGASFTVMSSDGIIGLVVSDCPFDMKSDDERAMFDKTWTGEMTFPDDSFDVEWFDDTLLDNPLPDGPGTYLVTVAWRYRFRVAPAYTPPDHSDSFYETVIITTARQAA